MSKQYEVMLDVVLTEAHYVEADNEAEAFEMAKRASNAVAEGGDAQLFQVVEAKS